MKKERSTQKIKLSFQKITRMYDFLKSQSLTFSDHLNILGSLEYAQETQLLKTQ